MSSNIVFTLSGPDRVGLVEDVTRTFLELGGNVGTSRMTRLGGEFAMLVLVSLPEDSAEATEAAFQPFVDQGYRVTLTPARQVEAAYDGWAAYAVSVTGADHEGIVHEIAAQLSRAGINIESMETGATEAPVSGTPLFMMSAKVLVPPTLAEADWVAALDEAARRTGVDIEVVREG